jgi:transposase-like protein
MVAAVDDVAEEEPVVAIAAASFGANDSLVDAWVKKVRVQVGSTPRSDTIIGFRNMKVSSEVCDDDDGDDDCGVVLEKPLFL